MTHVDFPPFIVALNQRISTLLSSTPVQERKTILLVDDDTAARLLLRLTFQTEPYQILEATDGETAIALCRNSQPDLILLNITLPQTDGITVLQQIRQINQQAIVFMVSAINLQVWIDSAFAHGADGFIAKPFSLLALRQMLARLLTPCTNKRVATPISL